MQDGSGIDAAEPPDPSRQLALERVPGRDGLEPEPWADPPSLEALIGEIDHDPGESWRAFKGLESVDVETRLKIIEGLAELDPGPGVMGLLDLLASEGDDLTRQAATIAREQLSRDEPESAAGEIASEPAEEEQADEGTGERASHGDGRSREIVLRGEGPHPNRAITRWWEGPRLNLMDSLVTAVDGAGRGAIGLSVSREGRRATALFLCDVVEGVQTAIGQVEEESAQAGELLSEYRASAIVPGLDGAGELGLRLLSGELMLNALPIPEQVAHWLEQTLGSSFKAQAFPAPNVGGDLEPTGNAEMLHRAEQIFDACPTWLDSSALTFELAEEIVLREGRTTADPRRDSGAFRFLFEHRIIHRLEQYGRMLLWMSGFWQQANESALARSARMFAIQLSDEGNTVPAHPFAMVLSARSLNAAQEETGNRIGPQSGPRRSLKGGGTDRRRAAAD